MRLLTLARLLGLLGWLPACVISATADEPPTSISELTRRLQPSIAVIRVDDRDGDTTGIGTGFVIDPRGLIVTNLHVIGEGRGFQIEMLDGRRLKATAIEASDRAADLAIIRVAVGDAPLPSLSLANPDSTQQGMRVIAIGNPLGLRNSVVDGIVSALRPVEGRKLIQLAMPIEPGNSGGPVVDLNGLVHGIINMKSAIDQNLGFAIPVAQLNRLRDDPNPVDYARWVRLGRLSSKQWTPLMGATWQQRGDMILARGRGDSFGGRSICLSTQRPPKPPYEIAVKVRLDDESGAAGLVWMSDGGDRHYGFYPSGGRLRLSCFLGPFVNRWQVLEEVESEHYLPGQFNRLRVRVEADRMICFVNGHAVIESADRQLQSGQVGLAKFRETQPDFKQFQIGDDLAPKKTAPEIAALLNQLTRIPDSLDQLSPQQLSTLAKGGDSAVRQLRRGAIDLQRQAAKMNRLANDIQVAPHLRTLQELYSPKSANEHADDDQRLLQGALCIAALDQPDLDIQAYLDRVDTMVADLKEQFESDAQPAERLKVLDDYLFQKNGFHGGRWDYYHPANSHLNRVLDEREGLPITLSILYIELGTRLGVRLEGVGLPGHFIVRHPADEDSIYIDPFESGQRLSREDGERLVRQRTGTPSVAQDWVAQSDQQILSRVLQNLIGVAAESNDIDALSRYTEALVALNPDDARARWLRARIRATAQRTAAALLDLDWLEQNASDEIDRESIRQLRRALEVNSEATR